jgi:hypothetical protein
MGALKVRLYVRYVGRATRPGELGRHNLTETRAALAARVAYILYADSP